jgi:hypothetical protein
MPKVGEWWYVRDKYGGVVLVKIKGVTNDNSYIGEQKDSRLCLTEATKMYCPHVGFPWWRLFVVLWNVLILAILGAGILWVK